MSLRANGMFAASILLALVASPARAASPTRPEGRATVEPERPCPVPGPRGGDDSPLLLKRTDVRAIITGPVAHAVVTQSWENPNTRPVDGLYIFPLPQNAAINDMQLKTGDRLIRAEMRRREEARALFEKARSEGRLAGLLDQERPNVFVQEVANLMPGTRVEVILSFDQTVTCEDGACEYVFPTVVGPRFIPARQADPGRIDPPVIAEGGSTGQTLTMQADVDAGVPLQDLTSPSHRFRVTPLGGTLWRASLEAEDRVALDRDVRLRWRVGASLPEIGLLAWRDPGGSDDPGVFTLVVQPPAGPLDDQVLAREMVFVLDCSGSMSGQPLQAAKDVVRRALRSVRPSDTFQIIRFSESASGLGPEPMEPTPANIERALRYLDGLQGEGGTEMISGIRAALSFPRDSRRLRIVAFLTDGYIGNEREILGEVRRRLGEARLFSFGIGSSVNRYLLDALAEEGRGASAFLGPRETPDEMVDRFVERIAKPVLTDLSITWENLSVEDTEPVEAPDLFAGEPLVLHGRYRRPGHGAVVVEGRHAGRPVRLRREVVFPERAADHEALARLWARARIHQMDRLLHEGDRQDVRDQIAELGMRYRLMTAYTSLVAVDSEVSNITGRSTPLRVPVEMPDGVSYEGIFGGTSQSQVAARTGAPSALMMESLRGLGYIGTAPNAVDGPPARLGPRPAKTAELPPFTSLTVAHRDGSQIVVEKGGELWTKSARGRALRRRLAAAEIDALRAALASARPEAWSGKTTGARLVVEVPGGQYVVELPSRDPAVNGLVDMIERWAS